MATKGRAQKGSRIPLTRDTKMTNYRFKFDGGKVGHLNLEYIVHKSVMRRILIEYRSTKSEHKNTRTSHHYHHSYCKWPTILLILRVRCGCDETCGCVGLNVVV